MAKRKKSSTQEDGGAPKKPRHGREQGRRQRRARVTRKAGGRARSSTVGTDDLRGHRQEAQEAQHEVPGALAVERASTTRKRGHFEIRGKTSTRTLTYNTVKTFAQSMRLMATTKNDLLDKNDIAGKREVYYNSKSWGECRFDAAAGKRHACWTTWRPCSASTASSSATSRRSAAATWRAAHGRSTRTRSPGETVRIDCAKLGTGAWSIPSRVEHLRFETQGQVHPGRSRPPRCSSAWCITCYYEKANCVLVSMSGVPTRACRRFIRRLADDQELPVLVFTDGDPTATATSTAR